jgi:hypothetical protein
VNKQREKEYAHRRKLYMKSIKYIRDKTKGGGQRLKSKKKSYT